MPSDGIFKLQSSTVYWNPKQFWTILFLVFTSKNSFLALEYKSELVLDELWTPELLFHLHIYDMKWTTPCRWKEYESIHVLKKKDQARVGLMEISSNTLGIIQVTHAGTLVAIRKTKTLTEHLICTFHFSNSLPTIFQRTFLWEIIVSRVETIDCSL